MVFGPGKSGNSNSYSTRVLGSRQPPNRPRRTRTKKAATTMIRQPKRARRSRRRRIVGTSWAERPPAAAGRARRQVAPSGRRIRVLPVKPVAGQAVVVDPVVKEVRAIVHVEAPGLAVGGGRGSCAGLRRAETPVPTATLGPADDGPGVGVREVLDDCDHGFAWGGVPLPFSIAPMYLARVNPWKVVRGPRIAARIAAVPRASCLAARAFRA